MSTFFTCPYRGPIIPRLTNHQGHAAHVCGHPAVAGPVVMTQSRNAAVQSCYSSRCTFWRDTPEQAAMQLVQLDPAQWALPEPPPPKPKSAPVGDAPCVHLGDDTGKRIKCDSCAGTMLKIFECGQYGECTVGKQGGKLAKCRCDQYVPRGVIGGEFVRRFDETNLASDEPGKRFNASIIADPTTPGSYLLAYRDGWAGSNIHLTRLSADFSPVGEPWKLELNHPQAKYGREDPRLFLHNGRVHVAFIGVLGPKIRTNMLYARLTAELQVEQVYAPHYTARNAWEKSWAMFSSGGELFAIYSIAPHQILRIQDDRAELAYQTHTPAPWKGGEMRGGASPILINDEWWHFFHDRIDINGVRTYRTGVYTFDSVAPFRVLRFLPEPIMVADGASRPGDQYCACVFTVGAVKNGDDWILSSGVHDRWAELTRFSHADLESKLITIGPPAWWSMRSTPDDAGIFASVAGANEYSLPDDMSGLQVLDIGGHVGTFAYAARQRGVALVHSYEPFPESYEHLQRNARHMGDVVAFNAAIGTTDGRGRFPSASEVEHSAAWSVIGDDAGPVEVIGLDTAIARLGRVDLLKIDCEGGEWPAFSGVKDLSAVKAIVGEWHNYRWNGRDWRPEDLAGLLEPHGFRVEFTPAECGWGLFRAWRG